MEEVKFEEQSVFVRGPFPLPQSDPFPISPQGIIALKYFVKGILLSATPKAEDPIHYIGYSLNAASKTALNRSVIWTLWQWNGFAREEIDRTERLLDAILSRMQASSEWKRAGGIRVTLVPYLHDGLKGRLVHLELGGLEGLPPVNPSQAVDRFRVERKSASVMQNVGYLLTRRGVAFAPVLALLEKREVLNTTVFSAVVDTQQEKKRLAAILQSAPEAQQLLLGRLIVVADQEGDTYQIRYDNAVKIARQRLAGTRIREISFLQPKWLAQLNSLLARFGYHLPRDPSVQKAARLLIQAA